MFLIWVGKPAYLYQKKGGKSKSVTVVTEGQEAWVPDTNQSEIAIKIPALTETVKKVDHPNVHFVLLDKFIMASDTNRVPVKLIHALPASKVKTITYPGAETASWRSGDFLPVPETTFLCNTLLPENLENFIDAAKVTFKFRFQAYIAYYLRQNSKTVEAEWKNDR